MIDVSSNRVRVHVVKDVVRYQLYCFFDIVHVLHRDMSQIGPKLSLHGWVKVEARKPNLLTAFHYLHIVGFVARFHLFQECGLIAE